MGLLQNDFLKYFATDPLKTYKSHERKQQVKDTQNLKWNQSIITKL